MTVLTDILRDIHVYSSMYFCDHQTPPWRLEIDDLKSSNFHHVRRGQCLVECEDKTELAGPGDIIFISRGTNHVLSHVHGFKPDQPQAFNTTLMCGYFQFDQAVEHPLLATLPTLSVIRADVVEQNRGLKKTLDLLADEYNSNLPGAKLLLDKLTEITFIQLIRTCFIDGSINSFSSALYDSQISRTLQCIHSDPSRNWTLDSLADEIGLSRTALANRFKELAGTTVFGYLTKIRMQKACNLLKTTRLPVYSIAEKSGYRSEISFIKSFKKHLDHTPGQYRKRTRINQAEFGQV